MKSAPRIGFKLYLVLLLASLTSVGFGCGIDWIKPPQHFESVSPQGYFDLWEDIGELDLGEGLKFPLLIEFESNRNSSSPILGKGWFFPLLESYVIQENENAFKVYNPNGWFRYFWRDKNNPNILNGQGGWKAEVGNNTFTAWADCGWKLVFTKGRLTLLGTDKGRSLIFSYGANDSFEKIREGNSTLLEVSRNLSTGEIDGLILPSKAKIKIERSGAPEVQIINGQKLLGGTNPSLSRLTLPSSGVKTYEFGLTEALDPKIILDGVRTIVWDANDKRVKQDGIWKYQIVSDEKDRMASSVLNRTNSLGQKESWREESGKKIIGRIDNTVLVTTYFVSGILNGKIRKIVEISPTGKEKILESNIYSESGLLVRQEIEGGFTRNFNIKGKPENLMKDNKEIVQYLYDSEGALVESKISAYPWLNKQAVKE